MKKLVKTVSVLLAATMLMSLVGCSSSKSKKKSKDDDESDIDKKQVVKLAEDFAGALKDLDTDKIKELAPDVEDSTLEIFDYIYTFDEEKNVKLEWLSKFEVEVNEDDIEIDDESAEVTVVFKYIDLCNLTTDESTEDEWIDAINDAENDSELELELSMEMDDEDLVIENGDKAVSKFADVASTYIYVNTFVYYDNAITGSWTESEYYTDDTLSLEIKFSENDALDGTDLNVTVYDNDYDQVLSETITYESGKSTTIDIKPSDIGETEFKAGYYDVTIDNEKGSVYFSCSVRVIEMEPQPTGGVDLDGDFKFEAPDDKAYGTADGTTYVNEFFGFKFDFPDNYIVEDARDLDFGADMEGMTMDYIGIAPSQDAFIFTMMGKLNLDASDDEIMDVIVTNFAGSDDIDSDDITIAGLRFVQFSSQGYDYLATIKDNTCIIICVYSVDGSLTIDDLKDSLKEA
ncbi:MAG: hypothetical protein J6U54_01375 [Clostridiales bacterium]|nr:hypothetical protein [Clostridiales bacterium]